MQAMWLSLKENVSCRSKVTDVVVGRPQKCGKEQKQYPYGKENLDTDEFQQMGNPNPLLLVLFRPNYPRAQFHKVDVGDPSRNIIETIFQKALINPLKPSRKIKRVLKVKNSVEILERFEKYREKVKKKAYEDYYKRHPRSSVDGNEVLRFYGTVMTCGERSTQVSELCKDPFCRVCRIIQSNFNTKHLNGNGIRMSRSSEEMCDNIALITKKKKKIKRAVIVCRIIAGLVDDGEHDHDQECDSFRSRGLHSNSENLIVRNSCAVLPCFVIVFT
ncbi:hypothetical protein LWI29_018345 [Acer saccharum]|uniref:Uncharacterized protein n=1 Tax=Acer saccharum TaxID=4024 RepID=A0AA39T6F6_ACESA|nr:hypothetical protein LWI29_018345 [Acer saccharum]KAK1582606.1 hypothetical protein Q3G72_016714 [Acer saccharum]